MNAARIGISLRDFIITAAVITALALASGALIGHGLTRPNPIDRSQPSGIWAGAVDTLPSGRSVECVFARDPNGAVAVTCDWGAATP